MTGTRQLNFVLAERRGLVDEVTEQLCDAIMRGQLTQGERINEAQVAQILGVSRAPVREAFARLCEQGIIERVANHGAFVVQFTLRDIEELWSLRNTLEQFAVSQLIRIGGQVHLELPSHALNAIQQALADEADDCQITELDLSFHEALILTLGHTRLYKAWSTLRNQTAILLHTSIRMDRLYRTKIIEGHRQVLQAIEDQDEPRARRLVEQHIEASYTRLAMAFQGTV